MGKRSRPLGGVDPKLSALDRPHVMQKTYSAAPCFTGQAVLLLQLPTFGIDHRRSRQFQIG